MFLEILVQSILFLCKTLFKTLHWFSVEFKPNSLRSRRQELIWILPIFLTLFPTTLLLTHQTPAPSAFFSLFNYAKSILTSRLYNVLFLLSMQNFPRRNLHCWLLSSHHWSVCSNITSLEWAFLVFQFKVASHPVSFISSIALIAMWIYTCSLSTKLLSVSFHHDISSMRAGTLSHSPLHPFDGYNTDIQNPFAMSRW